MLTIEDLKAVTGMHIRDINAAIIAEDFPRPVMNCGRPEWHESEVQGWMQSQTTVGALRWLR